MVRVVGRADPGEGLGRLRVATRHVVGAAQVVPVALGVIGIELHRPLDPVDALFRPAQPGQELALLHDDQIVVRIEAQRPLLVVHGLVVAGAAPGSMRRGCGARRCRCRRAPARSAAPRPPRRSVASRSSHQPYTQAWPRTQAFQAWAWAYFGSSAIARSSMRCASLVVLARRAVMQHLAGQHVFVRRHVGGGLALRPIVARRLDPPGQRRDDRRGHLVLDGEDVLELAVVALGPDVPVGDRIDQLHGDADPVARLAHAALDHVLDADLLREVLDPDRLALVDEGRVARDHEQLAEAGQRGDDVLGEPVGEELLLRDRRSCWRTAAPRSRAARTWVRTPAVAGLALGRSRVGRLQLDPKDRGSAGRCS